MTRTVAIVLLGLLAFALACCGLLICIGALAGAIPMNALMAGLGGLVLALLILQAVDCLARPRRVKY